MKKEEALVKLPDNKYYILASSSYADDRTQILNSGDTFGIFDRWGDIRQIGKGLQGIYHQGTRFISEMEMELNHYRPLLLSSNVKNENELLSVDLTNPDIKDDFGAGISKGTVHISRSKFLQDSVCHELISLRNFGLETCEVTLSISFLADFKDIFEIRGVPREKKGNLLAPETRGSQRIILSYEGLDQVKRSTHLQFNPAPQKLEDHRVVYTVTLEPKAEFRISYTAVFRVGEGPVLFEKYSHAFDKTTVALERRKEKVAEIYTSNEQFNNWINRSKHDLLSLLVQTPQGSYPYAGVPWYNTVFGRDGIITALETLWTAPEIAKGVLGFLAAKQAEDILPLQDAEPGKILHEIRYGEMAETGEIPFKLYYGSVDTTPLFIVLAGKYLRRSGDIDTVRSIWDNLLKALEWIDEYGDIDGDGFVEYQRKTESGLANQGWKDSYDSISHRDGELAAYPVALCEVQGYVYDARKQAAYIARILGEELLAEKLETAAEELKRKFNEQFWDEELGAYVLALDAMKTPCRVLASNAGHCLFSGIADREKAVRTGQSLMSREMFTGWGIRTLSSGEVRYNPMSYHNGSVWPHDTALIAAGMARYGLMKEAVRLTQGLFDASLF
ncbi:MAG TPA: glycogen debranching N-terminal domain-containing protein, partial [Anseongella sp.]|nr:glycogen debranching N-terminal domain-containing protein [Anseongella sp.]